jgi:hypothetical protein
VTSPEVVLPEVWELATCSDRHDDVFPVPEESDVVSVPDESEAESEDPEVPADCADFAGAESSSEVEVPVGVGVVVTDGGS